MIPQSLYARTLGPGYSIDDLLREAKMQAAWSEGGSEEESLWAAIAFLGEALQHSLLSREEG